MRREKIVWQLLLQVKAEFVKKREEIFLTWLKSRQEGISNTNSNIVIWKEIKIILRHLKYEKLLENFSSGQPDPVWLKAN